MGPFTRVEDRSGVEDRVRARWEREQTFAALRAQTRHGEPFSFLDGPITANNPMGVHHAWGRTLKDVVQRYQAMRGRSLRGQNGFDCQGLWVEVEVERGLGLDSRRDIEDHGLDRFARACRDRVAHYAGVITEQSRRLGMWMDWERSYYTMTDPNVSAIWGFLKTCHERGWLYLGARLMPWCVRCGTSLSQHELADSYEELDHPSLVVAFPLPERPGEHVAVWTTTPWTLPANVAVAVRPDARYARVRTELGVVHVAEERVAALAFSSHVDGTVSGEDLVSLRYTTPFDGLAAQSGVEHVIVPWTEVSLDEGTGIVHIAPGCGPEDHELGRDLDLPVLAPLDEDGRFAGDYGWLAGRDATDAAGDIEERLAARGALLESGRTTHRYPVCWRCKSPLVHRLADEWFIDCSEVREPMREAARNVEWHPPSDGKRMEDWLSNMGDWCISRKRYWGLPLPFWRCSDGHLTVVGSKQELVALAVSPVDDLPELHRPWIDDVAIACPTCGKDARRIPEVGDCWLDAGIVPFSTLGWRNDEAVPAGYAEGAGEGLTRADLPDHAHWERWFPAEVVIEMREQVRLWFYAMLFMGVVLEGRAPYRRVLSYGRVNDEHGREMHKSLGNAIWFDDAVEEVGADTMRWMFAGQDPARDMNFGYTAAESVERRFRTPWNSYAFFVTYANLARYEPREALLSQGPDRRELSPLDRWLLARTAELVTTCREALDRLDTPRLVRAAEGYWDDLSNWYVRRSRRRFWEGTEEGAFDTLWYALVTLARCVAPVVPFLADDVWDNLVARALPHAPASVHLSGYPEPCHDPEDATVLSEMRDVRMVAELGRAVRAQAGIRLRQPLRELVVATRDDAVRARVTSHADLLRDECNVRSVRVVAEAEALVETAVEPDFTVLGPRRGADAQRIADALRQGSWELVDERLRVADWDLEPDEYAVVTRAAEDVAVAERDGVVVAVDTEIDEELALEGRARDLVRMIQQRRKDLDLPVTARVRVTYPPEHTDVVAVHGDWIAAETLASSLEPGGELTVNPTHGDTDPS